MRTRTIGAVLATALTIAGTAGCGDSGTTTPSTGGNAAAKPVIGVDYPRSDTDFWNSYIRYTPKFAGELGVELKTSNSQNDVAKLTSNVQTLISQGVKGIAMAPQDTAAIAPTLQTLKTKGIPVVTIDTRPDQGDVFMVVRADNRAYGEKACKFLGAKLGGKGKVVMLQGGLDSINGRDRTEAFNDCMKANYAGIQVFGEETNWDAATALQKLQTRFTEHADIKGIYMEASFALAGTKQLLQQRGLAVKPDDPKHVWVVSNDGIPEELKNIGEGTIDATVSQPADLYAKYAIQYLRDAIAGKKFAPGKTDHDSTIIEVRPGVLEDQLAAPLVTADGGTYDGVPSVKSTDPSLWGNSAG